MNFPAAQKIAEWVGVSSRDSNGRPQCLIVPAHPDEQTGQPRYAKVSICSSPSRFVCSCRCFTTGADTDEGEPCPSTLKPGALCYHAIAALNHRAKEASGKIYFYPPESRSKAEALRDKGGRLLDLAIEHNTGGLIVVAVVVYFSGSQSPAAPVPAVLAPVPAVLAVPPDAVNSFAAVEEEMRTAKATPVEPLQPVCKPRKSRKRNGAA